MGIDIYARWSTQTDEEVTAQVTGFSVEAGHVGYLREAYHGEPYATHVLVPEAFSDEMAQLYPDGVPISALQLRKRLPQTIEVARQREKAIYGHEPEHPETRLVVKSFEDFVTLCEEKEDETGELCTILASY
jgi:hypothetical protein